MFFYHFAVLPFCVIAFSFPIAIVFTCAANPYTGFIGYKSTLIITAAGKVIRTFAAGNTIFPRTFIGVAVGIGHFSIAVGLVADILTYVHITVGKQRLAITMALIILPLTFIDIAVGADQLAGTVADAVLPLPFVY